MPWIALSRALRSQAGIEASNSQSERRPALLGLAGIAQLDPSKQAYLAELVGCPNEDDERILAAVRGSPELMVDGIRDAVRAFVRHHAGEGVTAVLIEDAHWADGALLGLIDDLVTDPTLPLAVIAFARPALFERAPALWGNRSPLRLDLGPLRARAAARLVRAATPADISDDDVDRMIELAAGNPLVLEELVRAFATTGKATPSPSVRAVFESRIARLEERERLLIRAASVIGQVFWDDALRAALGGELNVVASLQSLESNEVIVRRKRSRIPGAEEFVFRHALLRDAVEETCTDDTRQAIHATTARWLLTADARDHAAIAPPC